MEICQIYQKLLERLRHYIADEYILYAEEECLTYEILKRKKNYSCFLDNIQCIVSVFITEIQALIRRTVEQIYEYNYNNLIECVLKVTGLTELLDIEKCSKDIINIAVENPISGLTISDRLKKHKKEISYNIKQNLSAGLINGDYYCAMIKKLTNSVENNYKKAIRITRTENHRVSEAGRYDAAIKVNDLLKNNSGIYLTKVWRSFKEDQICFNSSRSIIKERTEHMSMHGRQLPVKKDFILLSGIKTKAPGQSGVAEEDINCRCFLTYCIHEVN